MDGFSIIFKDDFNEGVMDRFSTDYNDETDKTIDKILNNFRYLLTMNNYLLYLINKIKIHKNILINISEIDNIKLFQDIFNIRFKNDETIGGDLTQYLKNTNYFIIDLFNHGGIRDDLIKNFTYDNNDIDYLYNNTKNYYNIIFYINNNITHKCQDNLIFNHISVNSSNKEYKYISYKSYSKFITNIDGIKQIYLYPLNIIMIFNNSDTLYNICNNFLHDNKINEVNKINNLYILTHILRIHCILTNYDKYTNIIIKTNELISRKISEIEDTDMIIIGGRKNIKSYQLYMINNRFINYNKKRIYLNKDNTFKKNNQLFLKINKNKIVLIFI